MYFETWTTFAWCQGSIWIPNPFVLQNGKNTLQKPKILGSSSLEFFPEFYPCFDCVGAQLRLLKSLHGQGVLIEEDLEGCLPKENIYIFIRLEIFELGNWRKKVHFSFYVNDSKIAFFYIGLLTYFLKLSNFAIW